MGLKSDTKGKYTLGADVSTRSVAAVDRTQHTWLPCPADAKWFAFLSLLFKGSNPFCKCSRIDRLAWAELVVPSTEVGSRAHPSRMTAGRVCSAGTPESPADVVAALRQSV